MVFSAFAGNILVEDCATFDFSNLHLSRVIFIDVY